MMRKSKYPLILCSLAILVSWSAAVVSENQQELQQTRVIELEFKPSFPQSANSFFNPRQTEVIDDFERDSLWAVEYPWTTSGYIWAIRDTADTYGPDTAPSGYRYAGVPATDIPEYAGDQTGYLTVILTVPWTWSALYISWDYWSSFEGSATNWDGGIIEISNDSGVTWVQIDSLAQGHLNPTYDARLAGSGALDTAWAYCYSTDPDWVSVSSQDLIALGYAGIGDFIGVRVTFASDPYVGGQGWFIDNARMADTPPGISETPGDASVFTLGQVSPNPMRDNAVIEYQLATGQKVCLNIYDLSGQLVKKLVDHYEPAGSHTVIWNSRDAQGNSVASGIYFLQFKAGDFSTTQKLLLLK